MLRFQALAMRSLARLARRGTVVVRNIDWYKFRFVDSELQWHFGLKLDIKVIP
jgi:hypothetical protein